MVFEIDPALRKVVERGGSDLHLKAGSPPVARIDGDLRPLEGFEPLTADDTEVSMRSILTQGHLLEEFEKVGEADFSYELEGLSRFRVNAFRQRGSVSLACRAIPAQVPTIDGLGPPEAIRKLAEEPRGMVLLTGTTGSGKATTLAAMIDHINETRSRRILTLEDPIAYLHRDKSSIEDLSRWVSPRFTKHVPKIAGPSGSIVNASPSVARPDGTHCRWLVSSFGNV